jgi:catechol 2,3-dioxygenase-like lactoylglutathione lyase family enzyme
VARGLDHIVHAVHDLDAAGEFYRRLGFTVGARNKHPWGTHNRIVQFDGSYIELLAVAEPDKIEPHGRGLFSFGAFHRDYLEHAQGLDMLLLNSRDAKADAAAYRAAGIGDFEIFNFERQGQRPDGGTVKLAFALVFAANRHAPDTGFATCQHYFPENFWNPAFQEHANGVQGIASVVMVADEPERHRDFLLAFTGADSIDDTDDGFTIDLPRAAIDLVTPPAFTRRFGVLAPDTSRGARLAALRLKVADTGVAGIQTAMGAVLEFELGA